MDIRVPWNTFEVDYLFFRDSDSSGISQKKMKTLKAYMITIYPIKMWTWFLDGLFYFAHIIIIGLFIWVITHILHGYLILGHDANEPWASIH